MQWNQANYQIMDNLGQKLEAVLFYKNEPVSIAWLAKAIGVSIETINESLSTLDAELNSTDRGVVLMRSGDMVKLGTHPEASELIESMLKDELNKDLGKAGLETLSIILYGGPISRSQIDYIRGVNSQFIIRNLLTRGLIERTQNKEDLRSYLYRPTFDLLSLLGVVKIENLPNYEHIKRELVVIEKAVTDEVNEGENVR